jgi:hypothetical protein
MFLKNNFNNDINKWHFIEKYIILLLISRIFPQYIGIKEFASDYNSVTGHFLF